MAATGLIMPRRAKIPTKRGDKQEAATLQAQMGLQGYAAGQRGRPTTTVDCKLVVGLGLLLHYWAQGSAGLRPRGPCPSQHQMLLN